jgi:NAD(P)-dependent dehydrogenase (short-subunit alcohol dehydrogenase family)
MAVGPVEEAPVGDLERQLAVNVVGPYRLVQALLPSLVAARGDVVVVNSSAGVTARPGVGAYSASMYAMRAIADAVRGEVNRRGVRVVTLHVGRTATDRQSWLHAVEGRDYHPERLIQPEDVAALAVTVVTMAHTAEVTEIHVRPRLPPLP